MKKRNIFGAIVLTLGFIALLFWLYLKVVDIGDKLTLTSPYLAYAFYGLAGIFVLYFIVRPFFQVTFAPTYTLKRIHSFNDQKAVAAKQKENYPELVKVANRLISKKLISDESAKNLKAVLKQKESDFSKKYELVRLEVNKVIKEDLKGDIRKIIISTARDTMYFTAVSQNAFVDVIIVLVNNFRQIKKIVVRCGFRPHFFRLLRLYVNVMISCFVADGAQNVDFGSLLGGSLRGVDKPIISSVVNGTINSFFMLRVGFLTRNLIFNEEDFESKEINILKSSFVEAAAALPELTVAAIVSPIINILKGTIITPTKQLLKKVFSKESPYPEFEEGKG